MVLQYSGKRFSATLLLYFIPIKSQEQSNLQAKQGIKFWEHDNSSSSFISRNSLMMIIKKMELAVNCGVVQ